MTFEQFKEEVFKERPDVIAEYDAMEEEFRHLRKEMDKQQKADYEKLITKTSMQSAVVLSSGQFPEF